MPDRVFDEADEVVMVDLPPDELLQRLKEGKVYLPQQAERAVRNFFRKGNLIALRELALRRTADRVDDEMLQYRRNLAVAPVWQTREALLLCIGPDERSEKLVRSTARMAAQLDVPWHCVYVETPRAAAPAGRGAPARAAGAEAGAGRRRDDRHPDAATSLAGDDRQVRARAQPVARRARARHRALLRPWRLTLAEAVGALGTDLDVIQIALPARDAWPAVRRRRGGDGDAASTRPRAGCPTLWSAIICAARDAADRAAARRLELANIVMVFLLAVVIVAVRYGRGPAVLAAFLSVGAFDFFYVPPRFQLQRQRRAVPADLRRDAGRWRWSSAS